MLRTSFSPRTMLGGSLILLRALGYGSIFYLKNQRPFSTHTLFEACMMVYHSVKHHHIFFFCIFYSLIGLKKFSLLTLQWCCTNNNLHNLEDTLGSWIYIHTQAQTEFPTIMNFLSYYTLYKAMYCSECRCSKIRVT